MSAVSHLAPRSAPGPCSHSWGSDHREHPSSGMRGPCPLSAPRLSACPSDRPGLVQQRQATCGGTRVRSALSNGAAPACTGQRHPQPHGPSSERLSPRFPALSLGAPEPGMAGGGFPPSLPPSGSVYSSGHPLTTLHLVSPSQQVLSVPHMLPDVPASGGGTSCTRPCGHGARIPDGPPALPAAQPPPRHAACVAVGPSPGRGGTRAATWPLVPCCPSSWGSGD